MISKMEESTIDDVMSIWLDQNISAHGFIPEEYWKSNYDFVKSLLPLSDVFVSSEDGVVQGFIGVLEDGYIAGMFVSEKFQNQGIGRKLLDYVKQIKTDLRLDVFVENRKAIDFYLHNNFRVALEQINEDTGEKEYLMVWARG